MVVTAVLPTSAGPGGAVPWVALRAGRAQASHPLRSGAGRWGSAESAEDVKRAVRLLAGVIGPLYFALGMDTGADAREPESVFGLYALAESAAELRTLSYTKA